MDVFGSFFQVNKTKKLKNLSFYPEPLSVFCMRCLIGIQLFCLLCECEGGGSIAFVCARPCLCVCVCVFVGVLPQPFILPQIHVGGEERSDRGRA